MDHNSINPTIQYSILLKFQPFSGVENQYFVNSFSFTRCERKWMVKKILMYAVGGLLVIFIGLQFVPVEKENPPENGPLQVRADIAPILERSCYDCHSNKTVWPWYSNIAPVSWLVEVDVLDGRSDLNFSEWGTYPTKRKIHKLDGVIEKVESKEMPLPKYLYMHSDAELSDEQIEAVAAWADSLMVVLEESEEEN